MEYFDGDGAFKCANEAKRQILSNQDRESRRQNLSKDHKRYVTAIKAAVIAQDLVVTIGTAISGSGWHSFSFKRSVKTKDDPGNPPIPLTSGAADNPNTGHGRQEILDGLPEPKTQDYFVGAGASLFPKGSDLEKRFQKTYENSDEDPAETQKREASDDIALAIPAPSLAIYKSAKSDKSVSSGTKKPPESKEESIPSPGESASSTMGTVKSSPTKDATATGNKGAPPEPAFVDGAVPVSDPAISGANGTGVVPPTTQAATTPTPQQGGSSHSKPGKTAAEHDQESSPSPTSVADMQQHLSPPPQQEQVKGAAQSGSDQGMNRMQELSAVQDPTTMATADMVLPQTQMTGAFDTLISGNTSTVDSEN